MAPTKNRKKADQKVDKQWIEDNIKNAIHHLNSSPGATIRNTAKKFGLGESTLRFRLAKLKNGTELGKPGRRCVFNQETEKELTDCISVVYNAGFNLTMNEIRVSEYRTVFVVQ